MTATATAPAPAGAQAQATPTTGGAQPQPPASPTATAARPGVAVTRRRLQIKAGSRAYVTGRLHPARRGFSVRLQIQRGGAWRTIDAGGSDATGRFLVRERVSRTSSTRARLRVSGTGFATTYRSLGRLNVYRLALASWYGPGFFGRQTGCGGRLGHTQLGVAHKTLPCGTKVTLRHRGRTVRVPVIDRGPYAGGREYDLTAATARRLRFRGHGAILSTH